MKGYITNIEKITKENSSFRQVLYTARNCQLVAMSLDPNQDIGQEVHTLDQFIRIEQGQGKAILSGVEYPIGDGSAMVIPAGTQHNVINGPDSSMKLYTLYAPPHHRDKVVHLTKEAAIADQTEHFDGQTSE